MRELKVIKDSKDLEMRVSKERRDSKEGKVFRVVMEKDHKVHRVFKGCQVALKASKEIRAIRVW